MQAGRMLIGKTLAISLSLGVFAIGSIVVFSKFSDLPGYDLFKMPEVVSWFLFSTLAFSAGLALPMRKDFGSMIIWVVYYMHIFPWTVLGAFYIGLGSNCDIATKLLYVIIINALYILLSYTVSRSRLSIRTFKITIQTLLFLYGLITIALVLVLIIKLGHFINIPTYSEIYQQRAAFKRAIGSMSGGSILSRIILIVTYTILPFSLATSSYLIQLGKHNTTVVVITIISLGASLLVFSLAAFKSTVALALLSFLIPIVLHKTRKLAISSTAMLVWLLAFVGIVSLIVHLLNPDSRWLLHYFRRIFIVPGMQIWFYTDMFPLYPPQLIRDAPLIVSQVVYGTAGSANSGLVGSGLALGGGIGVLLNMVIFGTWLAVSKAYVKGVPNAILMPIAMIYGYLFSNSATTTVLFSYGAVLAPFILAFLSSSLRRLDHRLASYQ